MSPRGSSLGLDRTPRPKAVPKKCVQCGQDTNHRCVQCRRILCAWCLPLSNVCKECQP